MGTKKASLLRFMKLTLAPPSATIPAAVRGVNVIDEHKVGPT